MKLIDRLGLAVIRPRAALALAGDRRQAGRSGSDLLVAIVVLVLATQLRALVAAGWLGVAVEGTLGVRAAVQTLTDALVVDLAFLVVGTIAIYAASGPKREAGRSFDFACVAALPLLIVDLVASTVVYAVDVDVPRALMWTLSLASYAWTAALVILAVLEARQAQPSAIGNAAPARRAGLVLALVALAGIAVQVIWLARNVERVRPMEPGRPAPQFTLPRIAGVDQLGAPWSLSEAAGKVVVVDFWATWCGPCIKAMPKLHGIARHYPDVVVVAINLDDANAAFEIFRDANYAPLLLAGDRETADRYGVAAIPHTVVIDREGRVKRVFRGGTMNLEREVAALLK